MLKSLLVSSLFFAAAPSFAADSSVTEGAKEMGRDAGKEIKKGARAVQDKTCTMVKGKMECVGEKIKHKAQNAADEIKDKADDVK